MSVQALLIIVVICIWSTPCLGQRDDEVIYTIAQSDSLQFGDSIILTADRTEADADKWFISFHRGEDIAFRFAPRFNENQVIRTTRLNGKWQSDDRETDGGWLVPSSKADPISMKFTYAPSKWEISSEGLRRSAYDYVHRFTPSDANRITEVRVRKLVNAELSIERCQTGALTSYEAHKEVSSQATKVEIDFELRVGLGAMDTGSTEEYQVMSTDNDGITIGLRGDGMWALRDLDNKVYSFKFTMDWDLYYTSDTVPPYDVHIEISSSQIILEVNGEVAQIDKAIGNFDAEFTVSTQLYSINDVCIQTFK
mmetsp:Transcript_15870/g.25172  ORF Transcript_15870/g.25172 Transcript_15870/m.25172 type:complete len:310 (+) Transcript_15870:81-1010(+)